MKDYGQIVSKIQDTPWLITEGGLRTILQIVESHINGSISIDEIRAKTENGKRERGSLPKQEGTVGVLPLHGPIFPKANLMTELSGATSMDQFAQDFRAMLNNDRIDAILLDVDSPGGSAAMIEEMANEIFAARETKAVYAVATGMCASAAYYLASQASEVYTTDSGIMGSIGTYMVHTDTSELEQRAGVNKTVIKEGRFKAALIEPLTADTHAHLQGMVTEFNNQFLSSVARGRGTTVDNVVKTYGEGGVLSAKQALEVGMVDGIRTYDEVLGALLDGGGTVVVTDKGNGSSGFSLRASLDKEKEHSEPGTGLGGEPEPRIPPPDEHIDDWKNNGGRLQRPPNIPELEDSLMDREQLLKYAAKLGIADADALDDAELATKVSEGLDASLELVAELKPVIDASAQQVAFAQAYPEEHDRLQKLEARDRLHEAASFANSLTEFKVTEGGAEDGSGGKETTFRLSTLAQEVVKDSHIKLAASNLSAEDLKNLIQTVATGGVQQGEIGSSRQEEYAGTLVTGDTQKDRAMFAAKVGEIMTEDKLGQKEAMLEAQKRFPELAQAYSRS